MAEEIKKMSLRPVSRNTVVVVNPNVDKQWEDTWNLILYKFPPLEKFEMEIDEATTMVNKARLTWSNMRQQAEQELLEYSNRISSDNAAVRLSAKKYCTEGKDKEPITHTQPHKRPPLVILGTDEGDMFYKEALQEAKSLKMKVPGEIKSADIAQPEPQEDKSVDGGIEVTIQRPLDTWDRVRLASYIEEKTGTKLSSSQQKDRDRMLDTARKIFKEEKERLETEGVPYVEG